MDAIRRIEADEHVTIETALRLSAATDHSLMPKTPDQIKAHKSRYNRAYYASHAQDRRNNMTRKYEKKRIPRDWSSPEHERAVTEWATQMSLD